MRRKGLTLNELMIVVLIVSVTAGLAIPSYLKSTEKVKGDGALGALRLLRAAEKVYYFDNGSQYKNLDGAPDPLVTEGYVQDPNGDLGRAFNYSVVSNNAATPPQFLGTATRRSGCNNGETITLNDLGSTGGTWTLPCGP